MVDSSLVAAFEARRPRMVAIAARALSSRSDAEDAVQEAWIRLAGAPTDRIENLDGWLTRVVGRICIDVLRGRASRIESAWEPHDADQIVSDDVEDPADAAVHTDSLGVALAIVIDALRPEERLAFVLHDLFGVPFAEIGPVVGRSQDAAKMAASRARRKVRDVPRPSGSLGDRRRVVDAFLAAAREGDFDALVDILDPALSWRRRTPRGNVVEMGANDVLAAVRRGGEIDGFEARRVSVDGEPGILAWDRSGRPIALMACTVAHGRIVDVVSIVGVRSLADMALPGRDED